MPCCTSIKAMTALLAMDETFAAGADSATVVFNTAKPAAATADPAIRCPRVNSVFADSDIQHLERSSVARTPACAFHCMRSGDRKVGFNHENFSVRFRAGTTPSTRHSCRHRRAAHVHVAFYYLARFRNEAFMSNVRAGTRSRRAPRRRSNGGRGRARAGLSQEALRAAWQPSSLPLSAGGFGIPMETDPAGADRSSPGRYVTPGI